MKFSNSIKVFHKYSYLLQLLVARDFKVKYKRSALGVLWSVLNPLFTMIILNIVFSSMFGMGKAKDIPDYPVYLLTGLVIFNYFSEATNLAMGAVVTNFNLITKVYIPKYIFPLSKVLSSALNLLFSLVALYAIVLFEIAKGKPLVLSWANFLLPYDLLCIIIFSIGMGLFLSTLTVFFRDMYYIYGVILTAWTYLTPVMYPMSMITDSKLSYRFLFADCMKFNPMYHFINYARTIVMNGAVPTLGQHLIILACALIMLTIGVLFFRAQQDKFIYYI